MTSDRPVAERLLYMAFLMLKEGGYLMLVYLYTSHAGYDKKPATRGDAPSD